MVIQLKGKGKLLLLPVVQLFYAPNTQGDKPFLFRSSQLELWERENSCCLPATRFTITHTKDAFSCFCRSLATIVSGGRGKEKTVQKTVYFSSFFLDWAHNSIQQPVSSWCLYDFIYHHSFIQLHSIQHFSLSDSRCVFSVYPFVCLVCAIWQRWPPPLPPPTMTTRADNEA